MGFVTVNSITLNTQHHGDSHGETLAFINSLGSDMRIWSEMLLHGFETYGCVLYDKRGHGLSDCPSAPYTIRDHTNDLESLLAEFEIVQQKEQIVLIGISVGGMIAMDYTATHPEHVKALVLMDTFPKIGTETMWNERINTLRQHGMAHLGDAILARWFAPSYQEIHPADYSGYYNMLTRMPLEGYTGTCEAIRDADLTDAAHKIDCPTLILCGDQDQSTLPELVRELTGILPYSRYVEIKDAGHLPCVENPKATAAAIHTFLEEVL